MRIRATTKRWEGIVIFVNECRARVKIFGGKRHEFTTRFTEKKVSFEAPQYLDICPTSAVEIL